MPVSLGFPFWGMAPPSTHMPKPEAWASFSPTLVKYIEPIQNSHFSRQLALAISSPFCSVNIYRYSSTCPIQGARDTLLKQISYALPPQPHSLDLLWILVALPQGLPYLCDSLSLNFTQDLSLN